MPMCISCVSGYHQFCQLGECACYQAAHAYEPSRKVRIYVTPGAMKDAEERLQKIRTYMALMATVEDNTEKMRLLTLSEECMADVEEIMKGC